MPLHVHMSPRDTGEAHRAATPLELYFDLPAHQIVQRGLPAFRVGPAFRPRGGPLARYGIPLVSAAVLAAALTPEPVLVVGLLLAGLVALKVRAASRPSPAPSASSPVPGPSSQLPR